MNLSVEIAVDVVAADGFADELRVSSAEGREWAVIVSIGEEMAIVRGVDLMAAVSRAMLE